MPRSVISATRKYARLRTDPTAIASSGPTVRAAHLPPAARIAERVIRTAFDGPWSVRVRAVSVATRAVTLAVAAALFGLFVAVVIGRLHYPAEIEWMTGSVRDHVARVRAGQPIYTAPSVDWIPFIYPPLYYWLSAAAAAIGSVRLGCHFVSLASTALSAACVAAIAAQLGAKRYWRWVAVGLFFSAYSFTGYWYDLERCDPLFVALLLASTAVLLSRPNLRGAVGGGALMGLAFFAKQPALLFVMAATAGVAWERGRRHALAFVAAAGAIVAVGTVYLNAVTDHWFSFYVWTLPSAHGIKNYLIYSFFVTDVCNAFVLTSVTCLVATYLTCVALTRWIARRTITTRSGWRLFGSLLTASFVASGLSRLHLGGWDNVLMFWVAFACPAVAVVATALEEAMARRGGDVADAAAIALSAACALQMGHFAYDSSDHTNSRERARQDGLVRQRVRELEKDGEVFVLGRGDVSRATHFHVAAFADVLRAGFPVPTSVTRAFEARRFAAFVIDEFQELGMEYTLERRSPFFQTVTANYYVAERWDDDELSPPTGWYAHPGWVLRPRSHPLVGLDEAALLRRQRIEIAIAETRMHLKLAGAQVPEDGRDIEELAARMDAQGLRPGT